MEGGVGADDVDGSVFDECCWRDGEGVGWGGEGFYGDGFTAIVISKVLVLFSVSESK